MARTDAGGCSGAKPLTEPPPPLLPPLPLPVPSLPPPAPPPPLKLPLPSLPPPAPPPAVNLALPLLPPPAPLALPQRPATLPRPLASKLNQSRLPGRPGRPPAARARRIDPRRTSPLARFPAVTVRLEATIVCRVIRSVLQANYRRSLQASSLIGPSTCVVLASKLACGRRSPWEWQEAGGQGCTRAHSGEGLGMPGLTTVVCGAG